MALFFMATYNETMIFTGLEQNRPHMLIGVMVRVKMKRPIDASTARPVDKKSKVEPSSRKIHDVKTKPQSSSIVSSRKSSSSSVEEKPKSQRISTETPEKSEKPEKPVTPIEERKYHGPSVMAKPKVVPKTVPPLLSPSVTRPSGFYTPRLEKSLGGNTPTSGSNTPSASDKHILSVDSKDPIVQNYGMEVSTEDSGGKISYVVF